jgi:uncharacterized protein YprB with RNaseH-like and TPR domain
MIDDRLRSRLEQLNRGPLPQGSIPAQPLQAAPRQQLAGAALRPRAVKPLADLIQRGRAVANEAGEHWRIILPLEELWPGGEELATKRHAHLSSLPMPEKLLRTKQAKFKQELATLVRAFPQDLLLVDLETCGLSGSSLFLIGMLRCCEERLVVELLLARNYAEERAVLASFWQAVSPTSVLVTFNGKAFDWPMLADRSARHLLFRGSRRPEPPHVDLLHHARQRWRRQLPDCKLQTLERHICGRGRSGDIPGSQIPAAYQQFVRTGKHHEMNAILMHNAIDLVTLLDIGLRLAG